MRDRRARSRMWRNERAKLIDVNTTEEIMIKDDAGP